MSFAEEKSKKNMICLNKEFQERWEREGRGKKQMHKETKNKEVIKKFYQGMSKNYGGEIVVEELQE